MKGCKFLRIKEEYMFCPMLLNFNLGNAIKYIGRCEHKNNKQEDIKKAIWYLERELKKINAI